MPKRVIDVRAGQPILDIASYARRGPARRDHFSPAEIALIARTVHRAPEVMVKVLSRGGQDLRAVGRHMSYLSRSGALELETDDGERLGGRGAEKALLEDWDLDLEEDRRSATLAPRARAASPKLVHKLLFSMPPGTPPGKVLAAVKDFAREEFSLRHRYALVLHTDEPHPHVHMVVKAVSEQGVRLHIRKATLRAWRQEFARHLRAHGVAANATERAVRGQVRAPLCDGIFRAAQRGESRYLGERVAAVARAFNQDDLPTAAGKAEMLRTRWLVTRGWRELGEALSSIGHPQLAAATVRFVAGFPRIETELEALAATMDHAAATRKPEVESPAR